MASATAQATGYVNTETILSNIPEYIQAQQQLERLKSQYEVQIEREVATIENLFKKYQSEKSMLNDLQRQSRENEIITKERAVKERQAEIFGQDGLMSTRSKQLLDPIKNIVQGAIDIVAKESGVVIVFDLASVQGVIFTDPRGDLTPRVLNRLGIK
jgi:outer membrane protein